MAMAQSSSGSHPPTFFFFFFLQRPRTRPCIFAAPLYARHHGLRPTGRLWPFLIPFFLFPPSSFPRSGYRPGGARSRRRRKQCAEINRKALSSGLAFFLATSALLFLSSPSSSFFLSLFFFSVTECNRVIAFGRPLLNRHRKTPTSETSLFLHFFFFPPFFSPIDRQGRQKVALHGHDSRPLPLSLFFFFFPFFLYVIKEKFETGGRPLYAECVEG